MITLIFLVVIVGVFIAVLTAESGGRIIERRPAGLLTWVISGNWPAKIGGALLIVGVGALLRYAVLHIDLPATAKLAVGIIAAAGLAVGALLTGSRRAISLALGGAAFGVAYLTAYSAYALFGYLPTLQGLGLLALTAIGAGVFAVSRSALSLAVLAMVGAFMAPAFAVADPGPVYVYGYYIAVSLLTLAMVAVRGWRPLIHLSFLFTLAGGVFFAWTADYFAGHYVEAMLPLLVALVAVHVAMPLVERRAQRGKLIESLDTAYLLALPAVAALTVLIMSPSREVLAVQLWSYAAIWFVAAGVLFILKREGMASHAVIGLVMLGLGLAARFRDLPWELVTLAIAVAALALAARRSSSQRLHSFLAGLVLLLGAVHVLSALAPPHDAQLFFNGRFFERLLGAGLLLTAGMICRRLRQTLDSLLLAVGACWALFALGAELARLELITAALILHWALALVGIALFFVGDRWRSTNLVAGPLVVAIVLSLLLARPNASVMLSWLSLGFATLALLGLALRPEISEGRRAGRLIAAIGVPIVAALWSMRIAHELAIRDWQFALAIAAVTALATLWLGAQLRTRAAGWLQEAANIFAAVFAFALGVAVLFDIERSVAAVALEALCLALLATIAGGVGEVRASRWVMPALLLGVALTLQANLLRWMGPADHLDVLDIADMRWPTLLSLLWAAVGAALTIWARRKGSRTLWMAGAVFLVGAAVKLLLLDFGSLGQLANILAVIAAGVVFLLVGWLAPMPPAPPEPAEPPPPPEPMQAPVAEKTSVPRSPMAPEALPAGAAREMNLPDSYWNARPTPASQARYAPDESSSARFAWTVATIAVLLITLSRCGPELLDRKRSYGNVQVPAVEIETFGSATPEADRVAESAPVAVEQAPMEAADDSELARCQAWLAQLPPEARDVHVVAAGSTIPESADRHLLVNDPGRNVLLVLWSNEAVDWHVNVTPDTALVGIWLASRGERLRERIPFGLPVLNADLASCARGDLVAGELPSGTFVSQWLGGEVASFSEAIEGLTEIGRRTRTGHPSP